MAILKKNIGRKEILEPESLLKKKRYYLNKRPKVSGKNRNVSFPK